MLSLVTQRSRSGKQPKIAAPKQAKKLNGMRHTVLESNQNMLTVAARKVEFTMTSAMLPIDVSGTVLKLGDTVEVCEIPDWLLSGLPAEDQAAIVGKVGTKVAVVGFDDYGHAELEFNKPENAPRTIWIDPRCLRKVS
jgi:hypothetical protein